MPSMSGDSAKGMPFCWLTRRPMSWARCSSSAASRSSASPRRAGSQCDQPDGSSNARRAAATAASTSASAASGVSPIGSSVDALRTAILAAELGDTHSPLMNSVSWPVIWSPLAFLGRHGHDVRLREVAHSLAAELAADAALVEPAERGPLVHRGGVVVVEERDAGAQLPGDLHAVLGVRGPDRRAEPGPGAVRQRDRLFL